LKATLTTNFPNKILRQGRVLLLIAPNRRLCNVLPVLNLN